MFQKLLAGVGVLLLCAGGVRAQEAFRGQVQQVDSNSRTIVVHIGGKERPIKYVRGVVLKDEQGTAVKFEEFKDLVDKRTDDKRPVPVSINVYQGRKETNVVIQLLRPDKQ